MRPTKPFTQWTGEDVVLFLKSFDRETWIKVGIGAVVLGLFTYFIAIPAWITRGDLQQKASAVEGQIIRLQTLKRNEKNWLSQKEETLTYIQTIKERLYSPGETSLLLGLVSKIAEEAKVSIVASKPREGETIEFPEPYSSRYHAELYDFGLEGGYHEIGKFMEKIESYHKILRVEAFQLNPAKEDQKGHIAELTLSAIILKEEAIGK